MRILHNFSSSLEFHEALQRLRQFEKEGVEESSAHIDYLQSLSLPILKLKALVGLVQVLGGTWVLVLNDYYSLSFGSFFFGLFVVGSAFVYLADGRKLKLASDFINSEENKRRRLVA
ncbi:MAG: hypothetical protein JST16_05365 [Bdellovibrionales bacterium]|nr:hypothetical protein [Bdellovibrionales bacterium]